MSRRFLARRRVAAPRRPHDPALLRRSVAVFSSSGRNSKHVFAFRGTVDFATCDSPRASFLAVEESRDAFPQHFSKHPSLTFEKQSLSCTAKENPLRQLCNRFFCEETDRSDHCERNLAFSLLTQTRRRHVRVTDFVIFFSLENSMASLMIMHLCWGSGTSEVDTARWQRNTAEHPARWQRNTAEHPISR